jgi:hypothetical protein
LLLFLLLEYSQNVVTGRKGEIYRSCVGVCVEREKESDTITHLNVCYDDACSLERQHSVT